MANLYQVAAESAGAVGFSEGQTIFGAAARSASRVKQLERQAGRVSSVLSTGGRTVERGRGRGKRRLPDFIFSGAPSVRMRERPDHSVEIHVELKSAWVKWMNDGDLAELKRLVAQIVRHMRQFSRGRLVSKILAKMNHPYGFGMFTPPRKIRRGGKDVYVTGKRAKLPKTLATKRMREQGFTSWDVVNRNTGHFEQSWNGDASLTKTGGLLTVANDADYAGRLAFGTKLMKAHGPFVSVIRSWLPRIRSVWANIARRARARAYA